MNNAMYSVVRGSSATRVIHFPALNNGPNWNAASWIVANPTSLAIPGGGTDPNVWLQVHDYNPFCFTTPQQCGWPAIINWGSAADTAAVHAQYAALFAWAAEYAPTLPVRNIDPVCSSLRDI